MHPSDMSREKKKEEENNEMLIMTGKIIPSSRLFPDLVVSQHYVKRFFLHASLQVSSFFFFTSVTHYTQTGRDPEADQKTGRKSDLSIMICIGYFK